MQYIDILFAIWLPIHLHVLRTFMYNYKVSVRHMANLYQTYSTCEAGPLKLLQSSRICFFAIPRVYRSISLGKPIFIIRNMALAYVFVNLGKFATWI